MYGVAVGTEHGMFVRGATLNPMETSRFRSNVLLLVAANARSADPSFWVGALSRVTYWGHSCTVTQRIRVRYIILLARVMIQLETNPRYE